MRNTFSPVTDFETYLANAPEAAHAVLIKLHAIIKATAPNAEELISYGVPSFRQNGMLVGLGVAKSHASFYVMSPALMKEMHAELENYKTSTATINFPFDNPLPATLVKKIVKARIKENEANLAAKAKKK